MINVTVEIITIQLMQSLRKENCLNFAGQKWLCPGEKLYVLSLFKAEKQVFNTEVHLNIMK